MEKSLYWASNVITIIETMVISKIPIIVPFHDLNFLALSGSDITKLKTKIFEYANQICTSKVFTRKKRRDFHPNEIFFNVLLR